MGAPVIVRLLGTAVVALALVLGSAAMGRLVRQSSGSPSVSSQAASPTQETFTGGVTPIAVLPESAQPLRVAYRESAAIVLATAVGRPEAAVYSVTVAGQADRLASLPKTAGSLAGLAVDSDGTIWFGVGDTLARVGEGGALQTFRVPPPIHAFAPGYGGPASPAGLPPTENGQITMVAAAAGNLYLGRLGFPELTKFNTGTGSFTPIPITDGLGDIAASAWGPGGRLFFTINHSATTKGTGNDAIGAFDPRLGAFKRLPYAARAIAAGSTWIGFSGFGLGLLTAADAPVRAIVAGANYDQRAVAVLPNATTLVRVGANTHEVAVIDAAGNEWKRIPYAAVVGRDLQNDPAPYSSSFSFAAAAPDDSVWFALWGRPEIYRLTP